MFSLVSFFNILGDSTAVTGVPEEMAGSDIYIVMFVTLIVWVGIFFYLVNIDGKLKQIRNKIDMKG